MWQYEHMPPYATWSFTKGQIENTFVVGRFSKNMFMYTMYKCYLFDNKIKNISQGEFQNWALYFL